MFQCIDILNRISWDTGGIPQLNMIWSGSGGFGLTYYEMLWTAGPGFHAWKIPNLRKISVSPWCNSEKDHSWGWDGLCHEQKAEPGHRCRQYVWWGPGWEEIREFMELTEGQCHVWNLSSKILSTVRHDPQRLFKWEKDCDACCRGLCKNDLNV